MADYNVNAVAACCGTSLHFWKLNGTEYKDTSVEHTRPLTSVAWNRNNKVLATGIVDGSVQLRYGSGELMTELPRGGPPPDSGAISTLSWSVGSKRLAAGTTNGAVYVHEMTTKSCHTLSSPTPQASSSSSPALVDFQSDDKYLAVASASTLKLYAGNTLQHIANLNPPTSSSNHHHHHHHTALASPVAENVIATGTNKGTVLLWDISSQTLKEAYNSDFSGNSAIITAIQFAPLQPTILFTTTANGCLSMLDRRSNTTASFPTSYTAAGIASLSIKEDCSLIAVGTHDGKVVMYDPRNTGRPLYELQCGTISRGGGESGSTAVTGIHWQHNYTSLSSRAKAAVFENMLPFPLPLQKEKKQMQKFEVEDKGEEEKKEKEQQQPILLSSTNTFLPATATTTTTTITPARPTSSSSHSGLGMITPLEASFRRNIESRAHAMIHGGGGGDDTTIASSTAPLVGKMQQQQQGEGKPSTLASILIATNKPLNVPSTTGNGNGIVERKNSPIVGEYGVQRTPIEVATSTTTSSSASSSARLNQKDKVEEEESGANVWSMRHPPPPSALKTTDMTRNNDGNGNGNGNDFKIAAHSPVKSKLLGGGFGSGMVALPPNYDKDSTSSSSGHGLREDILALHFDMLTQFQAQQTQMAELCSGIMSRQESLEEEVVALRKQLGDLLSRRDATVWM